MLDRFPRGVALESARPRSSDHITAVNSRSMAASCRSTFLQDLLHSLTLAPLQTSEFRKLLHSRVIAGCSPR